MPLPPKYFKQFKQLELILLLSVIIMFLLTSRSTWGAFPNLIPNPGFEKDRNQDGLPDHWQKKVSGKEKSFLKLETRGHHGQRAISILGKGGWQCKVGGLKPHKVYLLSLWIKRDGWRDGEYPTIKILDRELYLNEVFSWGEWMRLSWFLPSHRHKETSLVLLSPGMTHKLWFDDLCLTEFRVQPLSPHEGEVINTSTPLLSWIMPENDNILDIKIEVSRDRNFSEKMVTKTVSPRGNSYQTKEGLEKGKWYWRVKVYKNQQQIATSPVRTFIVRVKTLKKTTSTDAPFISPTPANPTNAINPTNSLNSINSITPPSFFPIGIYGAEPQAFSELKEAGFNSVQSYSTDIIFIRRFICLAEKHGLKALIRIPKEAREKDISPFFSRIRHSSAILAWYLEDEPEGRAVPPTYIWKLRRYIQRVDPLHPTTLVVVRSKKAWDYAPGVDIIMVDPYPIPRMPLTWLSESIEEARQAGFDKKPVWAVVQAFDWSTSPYGEEKREWGRNPTYEEERCLTFLSVVHGAQGIFYYTFKGGNYAIKNYPSHWEEVKKVVRELNQIYPLLLAPQDGNVQTFKLSKNKSIHYLIKKTVDKKLFSAYNGTIKEGSYLIAVNVTDKRVEASLAVPVSSQGKAKLVFENRDIPVERGKLIDHFASYGVRVYYLGR